MIEVVREDETPAWWPRELCCKCYRPTSYWYEPKDVAVCLACAPTMEPKDVPEKREWCRSVAERLKNGRRQ